MVSMDSNICSNSNEMFTFQHPYSQRFTLPYPIIKYILQNPTSKAWKKLIQTCKYFYSKNYIYPIENLKSIDNGKWEGDNEIFKLSECRGKLWICNSLVVINVSSFPNMLSSLIPKLFKCNLGVLQFEGQCLSWDEYQLITASGMVEWLTLFDVEIKYSDGTLVTFDKLLENFKNMCSITYGSRSMTSTMFKDDSVKNMVKIISRFTKLRYLSLNRLTEDFDFPSIMDFLLANKYKRIILHFDRHFLSNGYNEMLRNFENRMATNPPKMIPLIYY